MLVFLLSTALFFSSSAHAWERHEWLAPWLMKKLQTHESWNQWKSIHRPDFQDAPTQSYATWAETLGLQPNATLANFDATQPEEILIKAMDEPDAGMDQDLPEEYDPTHERNMMGGYQGPTSQGFRHMYFGGLNWKHPFATFQIPLGATGQNPIRFQKIAIEARKELLAGHFYWGLRLLGWALHYIQDLTQPFHTTQIPNPILVPWMSIWNREAKRLDFQQFVGETARTIGNYHYAYERWTVLEMQKNQMSRFDECLSEPFSVPEIDDLGELSLVVAAKSRAKAWLLGRTLYKFFGSELKEPKYNLFNQQGKIDYDVLTLDPHKRPIVMTLEALTCEALQDAVISTLAVLDWATKPQ